MSDSLASELRASLIEQRRLLRSTLVLNPVENFPFADDIAVASGPLHGLYNSDKVRSREQRIEADHLFAGRQAIERDSRKIYAAWADAVRAEDATLRLLSGLHAHIVLFMSVARAGETVLLLPVEAGGHMSGRQILERLGLNVIEMAVNDAAMCVDVQKTVDLCERYKPAFVFVDRSEGLVVENFAPVLPEDSFRIFDGSQYLSNIIVGDHPDPFEAGFDLLVATVHKNFPGPQKAMFATKRVDDTWREVLRGVSTYVSNMHVASTYAAGLSLTRSNWIKAYSTRMLTCAVRLEVELAENGVPVVRRPTDKVPTHHVWIREATRSRAFETFEALEQCQVLTNYRKLPYSLGVGLRLGLNAAARLGLEEADIPRLASLIASIRRDGPSPALRAEAKTFSEMIWDREQGAG
ncbi:MAG: PLP-dependent aminotransferase family protein [Acidimicrobiales bacterium]